MSKQRGPETDAEYSLFVDLIAALDRHPGADDHFNALTNVWAAILLRRVAGQRASAEALCERFTTQSLGIYDDNMAARRPN